MPAAVMASAVSRYDVACSATRASCCAAALATAAARPAGAVAARSGVIGVASGAWILPGGADGDAASPMAAAGSPGSPGAAASQNLVVSPNAATVAPAVSRSRMARASRAMLTSTPSPVGRFGSRPK